MFLHKWVCASEGHFVCVCTVMRVCQHVTVGEWVCECVGVFMPLRKCTGKCVFVRT